MKDVQNAIYSIVETRGKECYCILCHAIAVAIEHQPTMPKADNLAKIADYLGCSVDYLLGRTDNPNVLPLNLNSGNHIVLGDCCQNNPVVIGKAAAGSEPDELEQEVIRILKELPIRKRTELLTVMYQYLDENKKKEDNETEA